MYNNFMPGIMRYARVLSLHPTVISARLHARFDESRRGKRGPKSSREKNEGTYSCSIGEGEKSSHTKWPWV